MELALDTLSSGKVGAHMLPLAGWSFLRLVTWSSCWISFAVRG